MSKWLARLKVIIEKQEARTDITDASTVIRNLKPESVQETVGVYGWQYSLFKRKPVCLEANKCHRVNAGGARCELIPIAGIGLHSEYAEYCRAKEPLI